MAELVEEMHALLNDVSLFVQLIFKSITENDVDS